MLSPAWRMLCPVSVGHHRRDNLGEKFRALNSLLLSTEDTNNNRFSEPTKGQRWTLVILKLQEGSLLLLQVTQEHSEALNCLGSVSLTGLELAK